MNLAAALFARARLWAGFFRRIRYPSDLPLVIQAFRQRRAFPLPPETWALLAPVGGFLSAKEAGLLDWAARTWPLAGPVIELGAYEGRSTLVFARAGRRVHAVDAWSRGLADQSAYGAGLIAPGEVLARFRANVRGAGLEHQITAHQGLTHVVAQAWQIPAAILFVDAGHTYADVKGDLEHWLPHLLPGGLLIMHDVLGDTFLDVTRAASELLSAGWQVTASAGSAVAFTRRSSNR